MPYRLKPGNSTVIQVKKADQWHDKYRHGSKASAIKQLYVLEKLKHKS